MIRASVLLLPLCASVLAAQVPTRRLPAADATFPETFSTVTGFRVLADGRAIVSDVRDGVLQLLDFSSGEARNIGRKGSGPGEWGAPMQLFALPGDSTLLPDPENGRYLIILPDGRPGPTFRLADENLAVAGSVAGVDAQGRLYLTRTRPPAQPGPRSGSTGIVDVYRYDRRTGRAEVVAQAAAPSGEMSAARMLPGGLVQMSTNLPLAPRDATTGVPLGDFIIVRATPYRVDRMDAQGRVRQGPVADAPRIRVTDAEREAFVRSLIRPGNIVVSGGAGAGGDGVGASGERQRPRVPTFSGDIESLFSPDMRWPDYKPPFGSSAAIAAPDGRVWVQRSRAHDDPLPVYDVFDRDGRVVERVQLAARSRIIGFGAGSVFVMRTDDDELVHIERHPLGAR